MTIALAALSAATGAVIGSFVSTAALRSTRREPALLGRSHCDSCQRTIGLVETVPLVSFAMARGRCSICRAPISLVHPAGEAVGALGGLVLALAVPWPAAIIMGVMGAALLAAAVVDMRIQRIPNGLTFVVAICAAALAAQTGIGALIEGATAAAVAGAILIALRWGFTRYRSDPGLGLGDVKLIAALALWVGAQTPLMVAIAAGLGLIGMRIAPPRTGRIAFGPMIALSGWTLGVTTELNLWPR